MTNTQIIMRWIGVILLYVFLFITWSRLWFLDERLGLIVVLWVGIPYMKRCWDGIPKDNEEV